MMKTCAHCKEEMDDSLFSRNGMRGGGRLSSRCRECDGKYRADIATKDYLLYKAGELHRSSKKRARDNGQSHTITLDWVKDRLETGRCEQTGVALSLNHGERRGLRSASLDRADPTAGYTPSNTKLVCWQYNLGKGEGTEDEFDDFIRQAYVHRKLG